jgi:hypothetical protein
MAGTMKSTPTAKNQRALRYVAMAVVLFGALVLVEIISKVIAIP